MKIDVKKVKIIVMVPSENTQELRDATKRNIGLNCFLKQIV